MTQLLVRGLPCTVTPQPAAMMHIMLLQSPSGTKSNRRALSTESEQAVTSSGVGVHHQLPPVHVEARCAASSHGLSAS